MPNVPEGGESSTGSSFTTAGAVYAASTDACKVASSCSTRSSDQSLNSKDQRWSSPGTNTVGPATVTVVGGGLSGRPASL